MSYKFTEDFNVIIPDVQEYLAEFAESGYKRDHGLVVELAAIHAGATANFNYYSEQELAKAVESWTMPHPKPIIMNHDPYSEPVGRVMGARMEKEADGTPYTRLQVAVLDPGAVEKVSDGRYLTGSVGGKVKEALCSVCQVDWAQPPKEGMSLPCTHRRGKVYNGKVAMIEMKNIEFKEYSFVNMPADSSSSIRKIGDEKIAEGDSSEDVWLKPAKFFVLDMVEEGIVEYSATESRDVLDGMRRKEASPLYLGLKGAFLSAKVIHEEELSTKDSENVDKPDTTNVDPTNEEIEMPKADTEATETEDILAVAADLSADLSAPAEEDQKDDEAEESETEESTDEDAEEKDEEADAEEGKRPAGQEKPHNQDIDPENSDGADKSRESDEKDDKKEEKPEEGDDSDKSEELDDDTDAETEAKEDEETELNDEKESVVEPQVAELTERVQALEEENAKLRKALHANLVERVVDTKIALGILTTEDRSDEIEEHSGRTGRSLADTLRDLAKMEPRATSSDKTPTLEMEQTSGVVGNEKNVTTIGNEEIQEETADPVVAAENLFTDVLMGRKKA